MPDRNVKAKLASLDVASATSEPVTASESVPSANEGVEVGNHTHCRVVVKDNSGNLTDFDLEAWGKLTKWGRSVGADGAYIDSDNLTDDGFEGCFFVGGLDRFKARIDNINQAAGTPDLTIYYALFNMLGS